MPSNWSRSAQLEAGDQFVEFLRQHHQFFAHALGGERLLRGVIGDTVDGLHLGVGIVGEVALFFQRLRDIAVEATDIGDAAGDLVQVGDCLLQLATAVFGTVTEASITSLSEKSVSS